MQVVIIRALKYTGFQLTGNRRCIPLVNLAINNNKTIFPIDLINCNCQKLVSLDMNLIRLSCKDKIITPKISIVSEKKGLSFTCGLKKSNLTI